MKPCKWGHTTGRNKSGNCIQCVRGSVKKYMKSQRRDPAFKARENIGDKVRWRKKHGLPEPTRPEPVICECCGRPPGKRALHLDHDHKTGRFRGWPCGRCNTAIGLLGDSLDGIERARAYLLRAEPP